MVTFHKLESLGNDFVVIYGEGFDTTLVPQMADRRFGIGFDQLLWITHDADAQNLLHCRVFNSDGSEVFQCGNGMRAIGRFAFSHGVVRGEDFIIKTQAASMRVSRAGKAIRVGMGKPSFTPSSLPFRVDHESDSYTIDVAGATYDIGIVSLGNPHAVFLVEDAATFPVEAVGSALQSHPLFPDRVNASFLTIEDKHTASLRVFERGAGETMACGSGACASFAIAHRKSLLADVATIRFVRSGNSMLVGVDSEGLFQEGDSNEVFEGIWTRS